MNISYELPQMISILEANGYKVVPTVIEDDFSNKFEVNVVYKEDKPVEGFNELTGKNEQVIRYTNKVIKERLFYLCTHKLF